MKLPEATTRESWVAGLHGVAALLLCLLLGLLLPIALFCAWERVMVEGDGFVGEGMIAVVMVFVGVPLGLVAGAGCCMHLWEHRRGPAGVVSRWAMSLRLRIVLAGWVLVLAAIVGPQWIDWSPLRFAATALLTSAGAGLLWWGFRRAARAEGAVLHPERPGASLLEL